MGTTRARNEAGRDPLLGQLLDGRYVIESVLGEGAMGIVYRAVHDSIDKVVAIKVLRREVSRNEQIVARFKQEAQMASRIGNEHIVDVCDFGELRDGSTYFAMELLNGRPLSQALREESFDVRRTLHIGRQLCSALGAAHAAGIVHRDLKPDNVQLIVRDADSDFVKVLDFGIAKVIGASRVLTQAGQVFGTPHYMSPEQCAGCDVDHRTDIYAVGCMLYELATGRVPFDAPNVMGILQKQLHEPPVPPSAYAQDLPRELQTLILRCLAKRPELRFDSMRELERALIAVQESLEHGVERPSLELRDSRPELETLPGRKRRGAWFATLGLLGVALLAGSLLGGYAHLAWPKPADEIGASVVKPARVQPANGRPTGTPGQATAASGRQFTRATATVANGEPTATGQPGTSSEPTASAQPAPHIEPRASVQPPSSEPSVQPPSSEPAVGAEPAQHSEPRASAHAVPSSEPSASAESTGAIGQGAEQIVAGSASGGSAPAESGEAEASEQPEPAAVATLERAGSPQSNAPERAELSSDAPGAARREESDGSQVGQRSSLPAAEAAPAAPVRKPTRHARRKPSARQAGESLPPAPAEARPVVESEILDPWS